MKFKLALITFLTVVSNELLSQCSTQTLESTSCVCKDGSTDCALLPDLNLSWWSLENDYDGPTELPQSIRITGSTPNIGHGSLTVLGSDSFVCGTDTLTGDPGICPDGNTPRQLIRQRVYFKNNDGTMSYEDRWAGAMTYHPTHGHNHVDDWVTFTLRLEDENEPDPLNWPIIGNGAKIGFCLMDYGSCSTYPGHCKDDNTIYNAGTTLLNDDFPNYGLGGGEYGCSPVIQGISSGWTDIYSEHLDGMSIDIPPGTCNGDYWIVGEVDPQNHFLEEDESNNWTAIPFTLTQQESADFTGEITYDKSLTICEGDSVLLTATTGLSYEWNNGETTQSIYAKEAGEYFVTITGSCFLTTTSSVFVEKTPKTQSPTADDSSICEGEMLTLTGSGADIHWFDSDTIQVGTGASTDLENVTESTVFYVQDHYNVGTTAQNVGKADSSDNGYFSNATASLVFDVMEVRSLKSVKMYADTSGDVTIKLKNNLGQLIAEKTVTVNEGENRVYLNFDLSTGTGFYLEASGVDMPNLFRNTSNLAYPYVLDNILQITGPSIEYNCFYDWEIVEIGTFCPSDFVEVNVTVNNITQQDPTDSTGVIFYDTPISFCEGDSVLLTAIEGSSYEWNNNLTTQSIYAKEAGEYFVSITSLSLCSRTIAPSVFVETTPISKDPIVTDQSICAGEQLTLTAEGTNIHWFDSDTIQVGTGISTDFENITESTVFYAQEHNDAGANIQNVGKADSSGNGYFSNITASLVFDVMEVRSLKSVKMYADTSGDVTIKLKNNLGQLIAEKTVTVNEGENRVYLNFDLSTGTGFYLEASGVDMPNLFRNTSNLAYPYVLDNILQITGPSIEYNCFYDWEIVNIGTFCPSDYVAVNVTVDCTLSIDENDVSDFLTIYPNPASKVLNIDMVLPEYIPAKIELFNAAGTTILTKVINNTISIKEEIDISTFQKGIYMVSVSVGNKSYTKRLVIH